MDETTLTCRCGTCAMAVRGAPIMAVECLCASCAAAADRLERLPGAAPVRSAQGGTEYVLYRKDRVGVERGAARLSAFRLSPDATTRRVVADCCATPMFLEFQGGHWLSIHADRWPAADRPAMEMRSMVRDRADDTPLPSDIPNLKSHSLSFMARLLGAWVAMGFRAPRLDYVTREMTDV